MADVRRPRGDVRSVEVAFGQRCRFTALKRHVFGQPVSAETAPRPCPPCFEVSCRRWTSASAVERNLRSATKAHKCLSTVTCRHRSSQTAENAVVLTEPWKPEYRRAAQRRSHSVRMAGAASRHPRDLRACPSWCTRCRPFGCQVCCRCCGADICSPSSVTGLIDENDTRLASHDARIAEPNIVRRDSNADIGNRGVNDPETMREAAFEARNRSRSRHGSSPISIGTAGSDGKERRPLACEPLRASC